MKLIICQHMSQRLQQRFSLELTEDEVSDLKEKICEVIKGEAPEVSSLDLTVTLRGMRFVIVSRRKRPGLWLLITVKELSQKRKRSWREMQRELRSRREEKSSPRKRRLMGAYQ